MVLIRDAVEADKNFIYSTWCKNQLYSNAMYKGIPKDVFVRNYSNWVGSVFSLPGLYIKVACLSDEPEIIVGYSVHTDWCIYYCYVKPAWRKKGIAKQLVPCETITTVASYTPTGDAIRKRQGWLWNPWKGFET